MKLPITIALTLARALFVALLAPHAPAQSGPPPLEAGAPRAAAEALAAALDEHYVFPDKGALMAKTLREKLTAGAYDHLTNPEALAERLNTDIRAVVDDRHLRVGVDDGPRGGPSEPVDEKTEHRLREEQGRRDNFGFAKVERLEGNV